MRTTKTFVIIDVDEETYNSLKSKLIEVDFAHRIDKLNDGKEEILDLHGIAISMERK
jgi:hypothetical protein